MGKIMKISLASIMAAALIAAAGNLIISRPSHAQTQTKQVIVEMYGDSTTQGFSVPNGVSMITRGNEPTLLQSYFDRDFGNGVVRVTNEGVGGTEAYQLLNGLDGVHQSWDSLMAVSTASIVTINYALNDTYFFANPRQGVYSESPQDYHQILTSLVNIAKSHGKIVVLVEPNPSCNPYRQSTLQYYVTHMEEVAQETNTHIVGQYWQIVSMPNWQGLLTDCTHPYDALYKIKAQNSYTVLAPIVQSIIGD